MRTSSDILTNMKRPITTTKDPYSERRADVLKAASHLYMGAQKAGGELDFEDPASRVNVAIKGDKRGIKRDLHAEEAKMWELTTSARVLAHTALNLDRLSYASGVRKVVPALALVGRVMTEPFEVARISKSGILGDFRTLDMHSQVDSLREDLREEKAQT